MDAFYGTHYVCCTKCIEVTSNEFLNVISTAVKIGCHNRGGKV